MAFSFAQKKAYQGGGHGHPRTPPSYAPGKVRNRLENGWLKFFFFFFFFCRESSSNIKNNVFVVVIVVDWNIWNELSADKDMKVTAEHDLYSRMNNVVNIIIIIMF